MKAQELKGGKMTMGTGKRFPLQCCFLRTNSASWGKLTYSGISSRFRAAAFSTSPTAALRILLPSRYLLLNLRSSIFPEERGSRPSSALRLHRPYGVYVCKRCTKPAPCPHLVFLTCRLAIVLVSLVKFPPPLVRSTCHERFTSPLGDIATQDPDQALHSIEALLLHARRFHFSSILRQPQTYHLPGHAPRHQIGCNWVPTPQYLSLH